MGGALVEGRGLGAASAAKALFHRLTRPFPDVAATGGLNCAAGGAFGRAFLAAAITCSRLI
jgi:hypothetical protein